MTTSKDKSIEVLGQERRRRWSVGEKLAMVRESLEPGQSVSVVAWRNGINPNQLFHWRKLYQDGSLSAVSAGEAVDPRPATDTGQEDHGGRDSQGSGGDRPLVKMDCALTLVAGGRPVKAVSGSLGVARSQLTTRLKQSVPGPQPRRRRALNDAALVEQIKQAVGTLPSYGYRRVWGLLRRQHERQAQPPVNVKRVYRVMRDHDLLLDGVNRRV